MVDQQALLRAFHEYARVLLRPYEVGAVLDQLTDQVVDVLHLAGAGVSLSRDDRHLTFITATDARIVAVEDEQLAHGEGPCHEAYLTGEPVAVTDLEDEDRWPRYRKGALAHGVHAALGVPMPVDDRRIGALDLYRDAPYEWTRQDVEVAQALADMASGYVLNANNLDRSQRLAAQLQHALDSRVIVEQAKGVLAERKDLEPSRAFELLRSYARSHNTSVHAVARQLVDGSLDL